MNNATVPYPPVLVGSKVWPDDKLYGWNRQQWLWVMEHLERTTETMDGAIDMMAEWERSTHKPPYPIPPLLRAARMKPGGGPQSGLPYQDSVRRLFNEAMKTLRIGNE